jgi:nickel-dependent lactate racemase
MAEIHLGYGSSAVTFNFDAARFEVLSPHENRSDPLSDLEINAALDAPISSPQIDELVGDGDSVLIVVSDATRATASAQVVNLLTRRLIAAGVAQSKIGIIVATGIHRPSTVEEKRDIVTPFVLQRVKVFDHNAYDDTQLIKLGTTERGTPIELNRALREYTHIFLTGGIGFHYFAGFTGGRKSICPGLASSRTIAATHMLALDFEKRGRRAGVATGALDGNAVSEECERVASEVSPAFVINAIVDEAGRAVNIFAGDWREAHRAGCSEYLETHSARIDSRRELVIASCGGHPYDINMIQAHKTLDMAAHACRAGGAIILLARCKDGIGRDDFLKWFDSEDSHALADRLANEYQVNGQTAWALLSKAETFRVYLISDLPDEAVRKMRMIPTHSIESAVSEVGNVELGYIMPRGASVLPIEA